MSLDRITAIAQERWETGAHGNAHLEMPPGLYDHILRQFPPKSPTPADPAFQTGPRGALPGIPVVVRDGLPDGEWRLVDGPGGETLEAGTVHACTELADLFGGYECTCGEPWSDLHVAAVDGPIDSPVRPD